MWDPRYQRLVDYLNKQQWKEADRETTRLMLQVVGKKEGQWLDIKEIENFPCQDLQTLDRLWMEASCGRFGFSVQKNSWKQYGDKDKPADF